MDSKKRLSHGTLEGYKSFRCRCRKCTEVWERYISEYRENIFDERTAKRKEVTLDNVTEEDY